MYLLLEAKVPQAEQMLGLKLFLMSSKMTKRSESFEYPYIGLLSLYRFIN